MLNNHRFLFNQHLFDPFIVNKLIVVKIEERIVVKNVKGKFTGWEASSIKAIKS